MSSRCFYVQRVQGRRAGVEIGPDERVIIAPGGAMNSMLRLLLMS